MEMLVVLLALEKKINQEDSSICYHSVSVLKSLQLHSPMYPVQSVTNTFQTDSARYVNGVNVGSGTCRSEGEMRRWTD